MQEVSKNAVCEVFLTGCLETGGGGRGQRWHSVQRRLLFSRPWKLEPLWDSIQPGQALSLSLPFSLPLSLYLLLLHLLEHVFVWLLVLFARGVRVCLPGSVSVGTETDSRFVYFHALSSRNDAIPRKAVWTFKEET